MIKLIDLLLEEKPGLWANIRAKRARGEKPAPKGSDAYNKAAMFKVSSVSKAIQEIFGLKQDNANMNISYAKKKGLIEQSVKTTHGKGYLQKNYQGIKSDHN